MAFRANDTPMLKTRSFTFRLFLRLLPVLALAAALPWLLAYWMDRGWVVTVVSTVLLLSLMWWTLRRDVRREAARIVEEARSAADQLGVDTAARTQNEIVGLRERARTDLAATRIQNGSVRCPMRSPKAAKRLR